MALREYMRVNMMNIIIGPPAVGNDFFGREVEQKQIWRKLNNQNLLMLAPRRIGKTSLLKKLQSNADAHNKVVLYCSFAGCKDELGCVNELIQSVKPYTDLSQQLSKGFAKKLSHVKGIKLFGCGIDLEQSNTKSWSAISANWLESLTQAIHSHKSSAGKDLIICVDELPIFILHLIRQEDGLAKVRHFLNWFRDIRQHYTAHQISEHETTKINWILAGSIGLDTVTQRFNIGDTINDLMPYRLSGFSDDVAFDFIDKLAESEQLQLTTDTKQYLLNKIGWNVPYYIQIMIDALASQTSTNSKEIEVTTQDIDNAFESKLNPDSKIYFDYWRQRLSDELGKPDDTYALSLLNHICKTNKGVTKNTLLQVLMEQNIEDAEHKLMYLIDGLYNDGYIIESDDGYKFRMAWLQVYWQRRVAI